MDEAQKNSSGYLSAELSDQDFYRISSFVEKSYGISLPLNKKVLVQSRLRKRLRILNLPTFHDYCGLLFGKTGEEERDIALINALSTNKTDFFREPQHFDYLVKDLLPDYIQKHPRRTIKILSAGCSSGEEVYSLTMILVDFMQAQRNGNPFLVIGADISGKVLEKAKQAVYPYSKAQEIPDRFLKKYVLRSKNHEKPLIRMNPEIRRNTAFISMNLMDSEYPMEDDLDIIFCRNTLIYFKKKNQEAIVQKLLHHLTPGGYLFVGHSESLIHMDINCQQIKPTIYQKLQSTPL